MTREPVPRLPVLGWQALRGGSSEVPCMLDLPRLHYTTSGRASILLALKTLGVGPGQGVLLPTYHCPTMVAPVTHLGAAPVFYPVDANGVPQLDWLSRQDRSGVRVLLMPHYFGLPQPVAAVRRWCDAHGVLLIEDCAHALFGHADERPVGTWGDVAIGSLTKFLPTPEGGCLVMNGDGAVPRLAPASATTALRVALDMLEMGAAQGRLWGINTAVNAGLAGLRRLRSRPAGRPESESVAPRADDSTPGREASGAELRIDASLAHRQMAGPCRWVAQALPSGRIVARRRRHYERLDRELSGHTGLRPLLRGPLPAGCVPYVFPLWVDKPDPAYAELRRLGMPVFRWDRLWPGTPVLPLDCGRLWSHHVIQLACHQDLSEAHLDAFVRHLLRLFAGSARKPGAPAAW